MQNPADIPEIGGEIPVKRRRYPRKSRVFQGLDLRTARGCRIRSLHQAYAEQFDDQADEPVRGPHDARDHPLISRRRQGHRSVIKERRSITFGDTSRTLREPFADAH